MVFKLRRRVRANTNRRRRLRRRVRIPVTRYRDRRTTLLPRSMPRDSSSLHRTRTQNEDKRDTDSNRGSTRKPLRDTGNRLPRAITRPTGHFEMIPVIAPSGPLCTVPILYRDHVYSFFAPAPRHFNHAAPFQDLKQVTNPFVFALCQPSIRLSHFHCFLYRVFVLIYRDGDCLFILFALILLEPAGEAV